MLAMNFTKSVELMIFLMFLLGATCVGSRVICFLYMMELLPYKNQVFIGTIANLIDTTVPVLWCLYYWKINKYWLWFVVVFGEISGIVVVIGCLFLPESPKFLLT